MCAKVVELEGETGACQGRPGTGSYFVSHVGFGGKGMWMVQVKFDILKYLLK